MESRRDDPLVSITGSRSFDRIALVDEEYESGLVAAASPIRDFRDHIVAALNVSAPKFRFGERLEDAGKEVKRAADELSALLGWTTDLDNTGVTDSSEAS